MPDRMSNRMSEDMSDRMPEDLPVRKCINVMVGITRSKVIYSVSTIFHVLAGCDAQTNRQMDGWMDGWDGMGWDGMGWDGMDGMDGWESITKCTKRLSKAPSREQCKHRSKGGQQSASTQTEQGS